MTVIESMDATGETDTVRCEKDLVKLGAFESAPAFVLRIAQLAAFDRFFEEFREDEIKISEYTVLLAIAENPGVRQGVVANVLRIKWSNMTKVVRALEARDLIKRHIPPHDRRSVELGVTDAGRDLLDRFAERMFACDHQSVSMLDDQEKAELVRLSRKVAGWPELDTQHSGTVKKMNLDDVLAIDFHTHAEEPCGAHLDDGYDDLQSAMSSYFRSPFKHPPTIPETAQYYREKNIAAVIFPVDAERETGYRRYNNEEVAELVSENNDILIPFASIDPAKGKMGAREARRLVEHFGVKGFKFHPTFQGFYPNDRMAYPLYEAIAEAGVPALFHTGQTGVGAGMPGGNGMRLKYSNPMFIDDVAVDFPDMPIVLAHPSFPWQEEALAVATHKPNVYIDLSGWSPKYFPAILIKYINSLLKNKMLFGSDWPAIMPDRWLGDFDKLEIKPDVRPLVLKENARRLLKM